MSSSEKSDKLLKKICLLKKVKLLKELEFEDEIGTKAPIEIRDHIVGGKSGELAECEVLDSKQCLKYPLKNEIASGPGNNESGLTKIPILATQDRIEGRSLFDEIAERQVNLEPYPAKPPESGAGHKLCQKRRPNCGPIRPKNRKILNSLKIRNLHCIPVIRLIELSTYIVKVTRMLLKYNDIISYSLSFNPVEPNPFARFNEMKPSLEYIAQRLGKVLRKYSGQNGDVKLPSANETEDFEAQKKDPKDTLWIVFNHMVKVKENLPDIKLAQSEFLSGLEIFIRLIEKYPFQYFYENRFVLPCPPTAAAELPAENVRATHVIQKSREPELSPLSILNILKNSIVAGCLGVCAVAIGFWILY